ncbi:MAG TPA: hypothetical protein VKQ32_29225 [Polyangia bacterium]|nr:hypothetical protein [Polyangia bacterium]
MRAALALILLAGCATAAPPPVLRDGGNLDAYVGKVVTLVGVQTRTKQPTVCGVDVDGDYALSDKLVRVTGVLQRRVVPPYDPAPGMEIVATRGPGVYYSLVDEKQHQLARPIAEP